MRLKITVSCFAVMAISFLCITECLAVTSSFEGLSSVGSISVSNEFQVGEGKAVSSEADLSFDGGPRVGKTDQVVGLGPGGISEFWSMHTPVLKVATYAFLGDSDYVKYSKTGDVKADYIYIGESVKVTDGTNFFFGGLAANKKDFAMVQMKATAGSLSYGNRLTATSNYAKAAHNFAGSGEGFGIINMAENGNRDFERTERDSVFFGIVEGKNPYNSFVVEAADISNGKVSYSGSAISSGIASASAEQSFKVNQARSVFALGRSGSGLVIATLNLESGALSGVKVPEFYDQSTAQFTVSNGRDVTYSGKAIKGSSMEAYQSSAAADADLIRRDATARTGGCLATDYAYTVGLGSAGGTMRASMSGIDRAMIKQDYSSVQQTLKAMGARIVREMKVDSVGTDAYHAAVVTKLFPFEGGFVWTTNGGVYVPAQMPAGASTLAGSSTGVAEAGKASIKSKGKWMAEVARDVTDYQQYPEGWDWPKSFHRHAHAYESVNDAYAVNDHMTVTGPWKFAFQEVAEASLDGVKAL
jgi:hypothetical protein